MTLKTFCRSTQPDVSNKKGFYLQSLPPLQPMKVAGQLSTGLFLSSGLRDSGCFAPMTSSRNGGCLVTLWSSGRRVFCKSPIDPARYEDAYRLVCDAAARGDSVGADEYPTFEYFRHNLLECASGSLSVSDVTESALSDSVSHFAGGTGPITGLVFVTPCRYARSSQPTLCTLTIIASRDLATDKAAWRDLIDIGVTMAKRYGRENEEQATGMDIKCPYSACIVDVFVTCQGQLMAYRRAGFLITACIPNSGKLTGLKGYADNFILYKEFDRPPVSCAPT